MIISFIDVRVIDQHGEILGYPHIKIQDTGPEMTQ